MQSVLSTRDYTEGRFLVFATRDGIIKKTEFAAYNTPINADGIIAINIRDDDELVAVRRTTGDDDILMVSRSGQAARFHESEVRSMGRATGGIKGMNVSQSGQPRARDGRRPRRPGAARRDRERLRQAHRAQRLPQGQRGTMGVKTITLTENKGALAGRAGRARARGARLHQRRRAWSSARRCAASTATAAPRRACALMNLKDDDIVSAVALVAEGGADAPGPRRRRHARRGLGARRGRRSDVGPFLRNI